MSGSAVSKLGELEPIVECLSVSPIKIRSNNASSSDEVKLAKTQNTLSSFWNIVCPHSIKARDTATELENYGIELWLKKITESVKAPYFKNKEVSD